MGRKSQCECHHQEILELYSLGHDWKEIGSRLSLSPKAIQAYLQRRGNYPAARKRGWHRLKIDREALRHLIEDKCLTQQQAAELLSCSKSAVERVSRSLQLKTARTGPRAAEGHREWKGGRVVEKHGYIEIYAPLHPQARKANGRIFEHRLVMEMHLGRYLLPEEVVDHIDNHPRHNWPDNLRVFPSNAAHLKETLTGREKATPRSSILGAYGCNQKIPRCPSLSDTLSLSPSGFLERFERYISLFRPTKTQRQESRSSLLRSGPARDPFQCSSTE